MSESCDVSNLACMTGMGWTIEGLLTSKLTVYCHEQHLLWLDYLHQLLQVCKDLQHHGMLIVLDVSSVCVRAVVDDPIHVQVQVVDLWGTLRCRDLLIEQGIPLGEPSVKLGDTCGDMRSWWEMK